ncbi:MAG: metallophosphoesterase [Myxococcota bacterium]
MAKTGVQELPEGPIDIIGDVHGEYDALVSLLGKLGYDDLGRHSEKRRLVFVGDLIDRGPDSPAVLRAVKRMVDAGYAWCIAGNHEINAIRDDAEKDRAGEGWWYGRNEAAYAAAVVDPQEKEESFLPFLRSLPGALEHGDLRVVHACWHEPSIERMRDATSVIDAFHSEAEANQKNLEELGRALRNRARLEQFEWTRIKDEGRKLPLIPELAAYDEANQMGNAIKVATSGIERAALDSYWASGKWRMVERVPWWEEYAGPPVVVGHYWRRYDPNVSPHQKQRNATLFGDAPSHATLGPAGQVMCIDYSVGMRFLERKRATGQRPERFDACLAALRLPEWRLVFDDERPGMDVDRGSRPSG